MPPIAFIPRTLSSRAIPRLWKCKPTWGEMGCSSNMLAGFVLSFLIFQNLTVHTETLASRLTVLIFDATLWPGRAYIYLETSLSFLFLAGMFFWYATNSHNDWAFTWTNQVPCWWMKLFNSASLSLAEIRELCVGSCNHRIIPAPGRQLFWQTEGCWKTRSPRTFMEQLTIFIFSHWLVIFRGLFSFLIHVSFNKQWSKGNGCLRGGSVLQWLCSRGGPKKEKSTVLLNGNFDIFWS